MDESGIAKPKKRKREEVSSSESDVDLYKTISLIKMEPKTPQRETKTQERGIRASSIKIKKERMTPARELSNHEYADWLSNIDGTGIITGNQPTTSRKKHMKLSERPRHEDTLIPSKSNRKIKRTDQHAQDHEIDDTVVYNYTEDNGSIFNPTLSSSTPIVKRKKKKKAKVDPASDSISNEKSNYEETRKKKEASNKEQETPIDLNDSRHFSSAHDSELNLNASSVLDNLVDSTDDPTVRAIEDKIREQNRPKLDNSYNPKELLASLFSQAKQLDMKCKLKFSKDEDIHIISIPKCIDPMSLLNVEVQLDAPSRFKIGKQKYVFEPTEVAPPASLVVGSNHKIIKPKSCIFIKKYIKPVKPPELPLPEKKAIALPDKLKMRHPLFGSDFEGKINLSQETKQKLNDVRESFMRREEKMKRKKSKKKKQKESLESEQPNEVIFDLLNAHQTQNSSDKEDSAYSSTGSKDLKGSKFKQEALTKCETDCEGILKKLKKKIVDHDDQEEAIGEKKKKKKWVEPTDDSDRHAMNEILRNVKQEISQEASFASEMMDNHNSDSSKRRKKSKKSI